MRHDRLAGYIISSNRLEPKFGPAGRSNMPSSLKPRARLTEAEVLTIFRMRGTSSSSASWIAKCYGVNEKTVRDIWTGRTWSRETCNFGRTVQLKSRGRPKGCKDSQPRKKKAARRNESLPVMTVGLHCGTYLYPTRTSTLQSTRGAHAPSIDDHIHVWVHKLWTCSLPTEVDPFHHDWNPIICDVVEPQVAGC
jgi:hypothetical protein